MGIIYITHVELGIERNKKEKIFLKSMNFFFFVEFYAHFWCRKWNCSIVFTEKICNTHRCRACLIFKFWKMNYGKYEELTPLLKVTWFRWHFFLILTKISNFFRENKYLQFDIYSFRFVFLVFEEIISYKIFLPVPIFSEKAISHYWFLIFIKKISEIHILL